MFSSGSHFTQLVDEESGQPRVLCAGVQPVSAAGVGLRCRFGNQEVAAQQDTQGTISCCPPLSPQGDDSATKVLLQVLANGSCIAEDTYDFKEQCLSRRHVNSSTTNLAASGEAPDGAAITEAACAPRAKETRTEAVKRHMEGLMPFVIISCSYLLYTITDGAIRMIVLLHAYNSGFTAWDVAIMFSAYELAGVFTNLMAGVAGAKWGIKTTLMTGLCLQIVGISLLFAWKDEWGQDGHRWKGILFVTMAQLPCGIAKDLTKLGGKTVTKLVTPDEKQSRLFKLVSFITGFKNSLKGAGYFLGAVTVSYNYYMSLGILLGLIFLAMPWAAISLSDQLGRTRKENLTLSKIFKQSYNVNVLSFSRYFLFGSRDMWFEVPLPFFLRDQAEGLGWSRTITGLFLAVWIIVYGQIQSWTPQLVLQPLKQSPANKYVAVLWNIILVACPLFMAIILQTSDIFKDHDVNAMTAVIVSGLAAFCLVFAVNSSVHSYLIVRYADGDKAAINVGFYYMANAMGRLTGTLVSGALYSFSSDSLATAFAACFWASVAFAAMSAVIEGFVRDDVGGLMCGRCFPMIRAPPTAVKEEQAEIVTVTMEDMTKD